jgi:hypothetical protein
MQSNDIYSSLPTEGSFKADIRSCATNSYPPDENAIHILRQDRAHDPQTVFKAFRLKAKDDCSHIREATGRLLCFITVIPIEKKCSIFSPFPEHLSLSAAFVAQSHQAVSQPVKDYASRHALR